MKITQEVRVYAAAQGIAEKEALAHGMNERSQAFLEMGADVYVPPRPEEEPQ